MLSLFLLSPLVASWAKFESMSQLRGMIKLSPIMAEIQANNLEHSSSIVRSGESVWGRAQLA